MYVMLVKRFMHTEYVAERSVILLGGKTSSVVLKNPPNWLEFNIKDRGTE